MTLMNSESSPQAGRSGVVGGETGLERVATFASADLTAIRNLLRGGSVIDWHRLYFTDRQQVDRFLRINEIGCWLFGVSGSDRRLSRVAPIATSGLRISWARCAAISLMVARRSCCSR